MEGVITLENVTFIIAIGGVAFGIYHFFRNPDIDADKRICLLEEAIKNDYALIQKDISLIKENHLTHIQAQLEDNTRTHLEFSKAINNINNSLTRIETKLEK